MTLSSDARALKPKYAFAPGDNGESRFAVRYDDPRIGAGGVGGLAFVGQFAVSAQVPADGVVHELPYEVPTDFVGTAWDASALLSGGHVVPAVTETYPFGRWLLMQVQVSAIRTSDGMPVNEPLQVGIGGGDWFSSPDTYLPGGHDRGQSWDRTYIDTWSAGDYLHCMVTVDPAEGSTVFVSVDLVIFDMGAASAPGEPGAGARLYERGTALPTAGQPMAFGLFAETTNPTSGTYTISLNGGTTPPIPFDALSSTVTPLLEALPGVGAGNVLMNDWNEDPSLAVEGYMDFELDGVLARTTLPGFSIDVSLLDGDVGGYAEDHVASDPVAPPAGSIALMRSPTRPDRFSSMIQRGPALDPKWELLPGQMYLPTDDTAWSNMGQGYSGAGIAAGDEALAGEGRVQGAFNVTVGTAQMYQSRIAGDQSTQVQADVTVQSQAAGGGVDGPGQAQVIASAHGTQTARNAQMLLMNNEITDANLQALLAVYAPDFVAKAAVQWDGFSGIFEALGQLLDGSRVARLYLDESSFLLRHTHAAGSEEINVSADGSLELNVRDGLSVKGQVQVTTDGVAINANGGGLVMMETLPTSDPNVSGALWNDAGTLKVSAG